MKEMNSVNENSWTAQIRSLIPPLFLHIYRDVRYGQSYRDASGITARKVQFTLPERSMVELFPGIDTVHVTTPVSELYRPRDMVVPLPELLTLAAICRYIKPRRIFEIGTYTGSSTLEMAINTPDDTEILTLDLAPGELIGSAFHDSIYNSKIGQLYGNSLEFDYTPYEHSIDLVLVDANHSYECVSSDTEKAFSMLRPGGVIVWDDYRWLEEHFECSGVTRFLNEFQAKRPLFSIAGTRFAIYVDQG